MKKLLLSSILIASAGSSFANVEIFKDPVFVLCPDQLQLPGCTPTLKTKEGQKHLVDSSYVSNFLQEHKSEKFIVEVPVKEVMGVVVTEKGHFPNPTAEFSVIKIIKVIED